MSNRLRGLWKWLAALVLLAAVALAPLMAKPPDPPVLVVASDFLSYICERPFFADQSYGATLLLVIQATALVALPRCGSRLAGRFVKVPLLDRPPSTKGASSP